MSSFTHISATLNSKNQSSSTVEPPDNTQAERMVSTHNKDLTAFFAVGMVINILIVGAFIIWGFKQWKRK